MSCAMNSQSVIITTAMAVSGAVIYLSLSGIRNFPSSHQLSSFHNKPPNCHSSSSSPLRSCLSSGEKKKKKKRVKFAERVKVKLIQTQSDERDSKNEENRTICRNGKITGVSRIPENQAALYRGILRDRLHRVGPSYCY